MSLGSLNTSKDWRRLVDELEGVFRKWKILDYDIPTKYKVVAQAQAKAQVPAWPTTLSWTLAGCWE